MPEVCWSKSKRASSARRPAKQDALVKAVSKGLDVPASLLQAMGLETATWTKAATPTPGGPAVVPYTPLAEIEKAVQSRLAGIDSEGITRRAVERAWERARGVI